MVKLTPSSQRQLRDWSRQPQTLPKTAAVADIADGVGGNGLPPLVKLPPVTTGHERANGAGAFFKNMIGAALMLTTVGVGVSWIYPFVGVWLPSVTADQLRAAPPL